MATHTSFGGSNLFLGGRPNVSVTGRFIFQIRCIVGIKEIAVIGVHGWILDIFFGNSVIPSIVKGLRGDINEISELLFGEHNILSDCAKLVQLRGPSIPREIFLPSRYHSLRLLPKGTTTFYLYQEELDERVTTLSSVYKIRGLFECSGRKVGLILVGYQVVAHSKHINHKNLTGLAEI